ncbi:MAG: hypothetical protein ACRDXC_13585, partial [Acidimicrobiales bacterium]
DKALPLLETALTTAETLELSEVLTHALNTKALVYQFLGRHRESRGLYLLSSEVARTHGLDGPLYVSQANLGDIGKNWDLPDAADHGEAALAIARRRGDRNAESLTAGNLAKIYFAAGRWDEVEQLCDELLEANPIRSGTEFLHAGRLLVHTARGEWASAEASLARLTSWHNSDTVETRANHEACEILTCLARDDPGAALDLALNSLADMVGSLTPAHEAVRAAWPAAVEAALRVGIHEHTNRLMTLLADEPAGRIPPYLRAQLLRSRALLDAAEGRQDTVESDLTGAIEAFGALAYPYWEAITRTDLAEQLIVRNECEDAIDLLTGAIATFDSLRANPALSRATALANAATVLVPSD